ncbi:MAG: NAD(P)-dependent oxidoreductase [Bdellovibrionales bacterium GWA2_49_15]|nr:MAG: NAD(P)-dependent oxidoreductase [Bdellovibrionales bacterium GWA2_49_15]HAZ14643.1 NAD(P)-dependent oxidoreductase [Bdellovibrionales bacterium]
MSITLITGATSGIGLALARKMALQGIELILTGRRGERLDKIKNELSKSAKIHAYSFDVSSRKAVENFLSASKELLPKVSVLVNNAGLASGADKLHEANIDDWETMIDTNVKGLLYMTRGIVPYMVKTNNGHIVNIGSAAGRWTYGGGSVYCATKFAVRAISEALRVDLLGTNIRVSNIEPGMLETEFSLVRFRDPAKAKKVYEGITPLQPDDIAETIQWVLSRPPHVNIQEIVMFPTAQAAISNIHRRT